MKKELPHFTIDGAYGGSQDWFQDRMMHLGGCAAATACDCCIDLDRAFGTRLCPVPPAELTRQRYVAFADTMKPYLRPRWTGIDTLDLFLEGFGGYLRDAGETGVSLSGCSGKLSYDCARLNVISQIDRGIPVPYLNLHHRDRTFQDFEWHWFVLNGYEQRGDALWVKTATYGAWSWLDLRALWNSGSVPKGGAILLSGPALCR